MGSPEVEVFQTAQLRDEVATLGGNVGECQTKGLQIAKVARL